MQDSNPKNQFSQDRFNQYGQPVSDIEYLRPRNDTTFKVLSKITDGCDLKELKEYETLQEEQLNQIGAAFELPAHLLEGDTSSHQAATNEVSTYRRQRFVALLEFYARIKLTRGKKMNTRLIKLSKMGIHFDYRGDEIIWLWRKFKGKRWYSVCFEATFPTLKSIANLWDGYEAATLQSDIDE
jgi:hypothetical protein